MQYSYFRPQHGSCTPGGMERMDCMRLHVRISSACTEEDVTNSHYFSCGVQTTQTRTRSCVPPQNGGHSCDHENIPQSQTESRSCAVFTCGQWGAWSLSCGGAATRSRSRTCSTNAGDGPCPEEGDNPDLYADEISEPENKPACWTDFGNWGDCSVECGGTGTRTRSKSCIEPDQGSGGLPCPSQNTQEAKFLLIYK